MSLNDVISLNQRVKPLSKFIVYMVVEFQNEPGYDFSVQENVDMFKKALKDVEKN